MNPNWKAFEYGSEFPLEQCLGASLEDGFGYAYLRSGRDALRLIATALKQSGITTVLLPCYCCDSMEEPFSSTGFNVLYYCIADDFRLDVSSIDSLASEYPGAAFLYMSYYGLPSVDDSELERTKFTYGLVLVRDATHDWLDYKFSDRGKLDDYVAVSLRKWAGIPDGGLVYSALHDLPFAECVQGDESFTKLRTKFMSLKLDYLHNGDLSFKRRYLKGFSKCDAFLASRRDVACMSDFSRRVAGGIDWDAVAMTRCRNSAVLAEGLTSLGLEHWLQPHSSPLWLPFIPGCDRDVLQQLMNSRGLYCPYLWSLPSSARGTSPWVDRLVDTMLCLPCDQRYDEDDMRAEISILEDCIEKAALSNIAGGGKC